MEEPNRGRTEVWVFSQTGNDVMSHVVYIPVVAVQMFTNSCIVGSVV